MTNNDITSHANTNPNTNDRIRKDIFLNKQFISIINNKMFKGYQLLKLKHANSHFNIKQFVKALPNDYYPIYDNYNIYYKEKYLSNINKKYNALNDLIQVNKCKSCFNIKKETHNSNINYNEDKATCTNEAKDDIIDNVKHIYAKIPFIILNKQEERSKGFKQSDFLYKLSHCNVNKTHQKTFSYDNGLCKCRTVMNPFSNNINYVDVRHNTNKDALTLNVTSYNNKRKNKEKITHHKWNEMKNEIWNTFSSFKRNVSNEIDNIFEHSDNIQHKIRVDNNTNFQTKTNRNKEITKTKDIFTLNKNKYKTNYRKKFKNVFLYMDNKDNINKEYNKTKYDTFQKEAIIKDRHLIDMISKCCTNEEIENVFGGKGTTNRHFMNYAKSRIATITKAKNYK